MGAFALLEVFTSPALYAPLGAICSRLTGGGGGGGGSLKEALRGGGFTGEVGALSASASPHAMVRPPSLTDRRNSFNGLSALGGKAASTEASPSAMGVTGGYAAPQLYPAL